MDEVSISKKIKDELHAAKINNAHGINLKNIEKHLIKPILEEYYDYNKKNKFNLWTVLLEYPINNIGYSIVYSENDNKYGLATIDQNNDKIFLGFDGTFIQTLNNM